MSHLFFVIKDLIRNSYIMRHEHGLSFNF